MHPTEALSEVNKIAQPPSDTPVWKTQFYSFGFIWLGDIIKSVFGW